MHRDIGEFYLSEFSKSQIESNIFEIVHHLNEGLTSHPEADDRQRMIDLNITAGRRARAATAYRSAAEHYLKAIGFTDDASWQTQHEAMISLYVAAAEAANLSGDVDLCASLTQEALRHIQSQPDRARICQVQVLSLIGQDKPDEAIDLALEMMSRLDVHLPRKPSSLHVLWKILKTMWHLRGREVEDFLELPLATDRRIQAARNLMFIIGSPCYLSSPKLWAVVIAEGVCLSIRYGQDPVSAPSFSSYGVINCILLGRFRFGYELGKISMEMARRLEDKSTVPMVDFVFAQFVQHWRDHVEKTLPLMLESHANAAEIGDIVYAGHAAANYCVHGFFAGVKLGELAADIEKYSEYLRKNRLTVSLNTLLIYRHGVGLLVRAEEQESRGGKVDCHDAALIELLMDDGVQVNLFHAWMITALSQYLFGQFLSAEQSAGHAHRLRESATGALGYAVFPFIESLIALACCRQGKPGDRGRRMRRARRSLRRYKKTARNAPMSHMHKYLLVEAEIARAKGKTARAMELYDKSIEGAVENRFVQDAALACELAGGFYLEIGEDQRARDLLMQAREYYLVWGATAKARYLERVNPTQLT
jgi:predicted ATPase